MTQPQFDKPALSGARFAHGAMACTFELYLAGGPVELESIRAVRDGGIAGIILGEPLLSGALDFARALEAAA